MSDKYEAALDLIAEAEGESLLREAARETSLSMWGLIFRWFNGGDPPAPEVGD